MTLAPTTDRHDRTVRQVARFVPVAVWMGLIFAFSAQEKLPTPPGFRMDITSVAGHLAVYAILAALTWWALGGVATSSRARVLIAFVVAVTYGITDEWHQSFVPGRHPDILDVITDAIGAVLGIAIAMRIAPLFSRLGT